MRRSGQSYTHIADFNNDRNVYFDIMLFRVNYKVINMYKMIKLDNGWLQNAWKGLSLLAFQCSSCASTGAVPKAWSCAESKVILGGYSPKMTPKLCYINFRSVSQLTLFSRVVSFAFCDALWVGGKDIQSLRTQWHHALTERDWCESQQGAWTCWADVSYVCWSCSVIHTCQTAILRYDVYLLLINKCTLEFRDIQPWCMSIV